MDANAAVVATVRTMLQTTHGPGSRRAAEDEACVAVGAAHALTSASRGAGRA